MEFNKDSMRERTADSDILFSRSIKAGKRVYYVDVKRDRHGENYLSITESKRIKDGTEEERPVFEKHKIFLYREDMDRFVQAFQEAVGYVQANNPAPRPRYSDAYSDSYSDNYSDNYAEGLPYNPNPTPKSLENNYRSTDSYFSREGRGYGDDFSMERRQRPAFGERRTTFNRTYVPRTGGFNRRPTFDRMENRTQNFNPANSAPQMSEDDTDQITL